MVASNAKKINSSFSDGSDFDDIDSKSEKKIKARENKYKNKWVEHEGIKFQSVKEGKRYLELRLLQKGKQIHNLCMQVPIKCIVNGELVCKLVADFFYLNADGKEVYEDVKGMKFGAAYQMFRLKKKLVHACTGIDIVEI